MCNTCASVKRRALIATKDRPPRAHEPNVAFLESSGLSWSVALCGHHFEESIVRKSCWRKPHALRLTEARFRASRRVNPCSKMCMASSFGNESFAHPRAHARMPLFMAEVVKISLLRSRSLARCARVGSAIRQPASRDPTLEDRAWRPRARSETARTPSRSGAGSSARKRLVNAGLFRSAFSNELQLRIPRSQPLRSSLASDLLPRRNRT